MDGAREDDGFAASALAEQKIDKVTGVCMRVAMDILLALILVVVVVACLWNHAKRNRPHDFARQLRRSKALWRLKNARESRKKKANRSPKL